MCDPQGHTIPGLKKIVYFGPVFRKGFLPALRDTPDTANSNQRLAGPVDDTFGMKEVLYKVHIALIKDLSEVSENKLFLE